MNEDLHSYGLLTLSSFLGFIVTAGLVVILSRFGTVAGHSRAEHDRYKIEFAAYSAVAVFLIPVVADNLGNIAGDTFGAKASLLFAIGCLATMVVFGVDATREFTRRHRNLHGASRALLITAVAAIVAVGAAPLIKILGY